MAFHDKNGHTNAGVCLENNILPILDFDDLLMSELDQRSPSGSTERPDFYSYSDEGTSSSFCSQRFVSQQDTVNQSISSTITLPTPANMQHIVSSCGPLTQSPAHSVQLQYNRVDQSAVFNNDSSNQPQHSSYYSAITTASLLRLVSSPVPTSPEFWNFPNDNEPGVCPWPTIQNIDYNSCSMLSTTSPATTTTVVIRRQIDELQAMHNAFIPLYEAQPHTSQHGPLEDTFFHLQDAPPFGTKTVNLFFKKL